MDRLHLKLDELREALSRIAGAPDAGARLATGWPGVDELLGGGLPCGRLVEIAGGWSSGKTALALAAGACVTARGHLVAYVDARRELYPPSAASLGVALERLLVVRAPAQAAAIARAGEIVTRSRAFPLVLLDLPDDLRLEERLAARLRAAAHAAPAAVVVLAARAGAVASAAVKLEVSAEGAGARRRLAVTLRKGGVAPPGTSAPITTGRVLVARTFFAPARQAALLALDGFEPVPLSGGGRSIRRRGQR